MKNHKYTIYLLCLTIIALVISLSIVFYSHKKQISNVEDTLFANEFSDRLNKLEHLSMLLETVSVNERNEQLIQKLITKRQPDFTQELSTIYKSSLFYYLRNFDVEFYGIVNAINGKQNPLTNDEINKLSEKILLVRGTMMKSIKWSRGYDGNYYIKFELDEDQFQDVLLELREIKNSIK
ncbi:hypothetical protein [Salirhabdus salicampi]|uniref:hypothetical protein n=1 Tax=Salirhabdus salicampi TaxID=476102 RepID=UPI0020C2EAC5|nr:hypothetical protein [Salirhabdus salicampi]MCP8616278.1 hypothetical protein [Salirhabdus salicampi]